MRGRIGLELDGDVAYRVGRAVAQHFGAKSVVVGFDARETSPEFAGAVARGVRMFWTSAYPRPKKCIGPSPNLGSARGLR